MRDLGVVTPLVDEDRQTGDEKRELYAVEVSSLGISSKLNGSLVAGSDLCDFKFSPDSTHVAYCADQDTDGMLELYLVELAVPGVATRLNDGLVAGGEVFDFSIAPGLRLP